MNINISNISKDYEGRLVFEGINGVISSGEKIALIGTNGIGKTTLGKIIAGLETFDKGSIDCSPKNGRISYLNQDFQANDHSNETLKGSRYLQADKEINRLLSEMEITEDNNPVDLESLSGGEKTKLMLSRVLLQQADLLVLDEPTNHLDLDSRLLLEKIINKLKKTIIIISHDRYFIDKTVSKIWELSDKGLREYSGNYSSYKQQKEIEVKNQQKEHQKQQKQMSHLKDIINERKEWFNKAHKAAGQDDFLRGKSKKHVSVMRSKERQLQRLEENKIDPPKEELTPFFHIINKGLLNLRLPQYIIQASKLNKSYGNRVILNNISFDIRRDHKVCILGKNGCGKTTLLNILNAVDKDYKGKLYINPSLKIAYFSQELEGLDINKSALDNLILDGISQTEARTMLANMMLKGEDVFKRINQLSMGQRSRVAIAKIILSGANLLILDEPTNYMDIPSKEKIEEVLVNYKGSIIFVSHDRYFINRVANKIYELSEGNIEAFDGNYDYYQSKKHDKGLGSACGEEYSLIAEGITKLECKLAYLGGRLNERLTDEEKEELNNQYLEAARSLRLYKEQLKNIEKDI